ncbi:MAG: lysophospholipid acyltransferase family protein, partial [Patescibacteria group bacterium]
MSYQSFSKSVWIITYFFCRFFIRPFYKFKIQIHPDLDLDMKAPVLIIANHRSMLDPWIISGSLPFDTFRQLLPIRMLGSKIYHDPFLKFINRIGIIPFVYFLYNVIPVDGETFEEKISGPVRALEAGQSVFMFPEGKINLKSETVIAEFKKGAVAIERETHVPILPVFVYYKKNPTGFRTKCVVKFDKLTTLPERAR